MPITLLLDLDDTLLDTNMDAFIPAYFKALSGALADRVPPETMLPALMGGTKAMMQNTDPALTLREVFDAYFFPKLGLDRSELQPAIDRFYDEVFPNLGGLTHPLPEAVRLVDWAFEQGHRVAIATNPLFPLKAIQHRLRWAGLAPEKYPFALVTSYETLHFTKETVAFYPEVIAQLGWPDDPTVMVGDDVEREVKPTRAAGVPVYWVRRNGGSSDAPDVPQGKLEDLRPWLEKADPEKLKLSFETPQALLATLRSTPAALATLAADLPAPAWTRRPAPGEWCLTEIVCHLRDAEAEVHLPRLRKVLAEANPFLPGEETDRWAETRHYADQDGLAALRDFTSSRKESLDLLGALQDEWSRPARHAIFGPTSIQELAGFTAAHDRAHIQQAWKILRGH
ncbi:MAG TPA: DinB family protein [Anaerolineales bacterium]|nr:DinB family protein [Anaerolineales bacterium]